MKCLKLFMEFLIVNAKDIFPLLFVCVCVLIL